MNRALRTATTGMMAQQMNIDTIAHNLANVNTTSFKKGRPEFQDLMYQTLKTTGVSQNPNVQQPMEVQIGNGVVPVGVQKTFLQGDVQPTENPLDVAIQGEGFLQVRRADGTLAYTRDGALKISGDGTLVTSQGYFLEPRLSFATDTTEIKIDREGVVEAKSVGESDMSKIGQLEMVKFVNPVGLHSIGDNMYLETPASGTPLLGTPGTEGYGEIMQGYLESSNVDVVEEMVSMIVSQRAYESTAKVLKTADEMFSQINNVAR